MNIALELLVGIVIASLTAIITVRLSLHRFRVEQWWQFRVETYKRLIEALYDSKSFNDKHIEELQTGRKVSEEEETKLRTAAEAAIEEIDRMASIGGFLLSDEVRSKLKQYRGEVKQASITTDWCKYLTDEWAVTNSCLEDIIEIARRDLKLDKIV